MTLVLYRRRAFTIKVEASSALRRAFDKAVRRKPLRQLLYEMVVRCPQRVHSSIWPPSAAVRHRAMASKTLIWVQQELLARANSPLCTASHTVPDTLGSREPTLSWNQ